MGTIRAGFGVSDLTECLSIKVPGLLMPVI